MRTSRGSPQTVESDLTTARPGTAQPAPRGPLASLAIRDFRLIWIGNIFAGAAQWVQSITISWLIYDLTGSGALLGAVSFARNAGTILLVPFSGVWADRVNRKHYMIGWQLFQCTLAAAMGVGIALHQIHVWHIFVFACLLSIPQALLQPVQSTVVFDLVPRASFTNAIALNSAAMNAMQAFGPSLAGFLIAALGTQGNFFAQSTAYFGVVLTLLFINFPKRSAAVMEAARSGTITNFKAGLRYVAANRTVRLLMIIGLINPLLLFPMVYGLLAIFAKDVFHAGPAGLGILASAYGGGGLLGAMVVAGMPRFERPGLVQIEAAIVGGLALLSFSFTHSFWVAVPLMGVAGFTGLMFQAMNQTILQLSVPPEMRGRISALFFLSIGLFPVANVIFGSVADLLGAPTAQRIAASLTITAAATIFIAAPHLRNLRIGDLTERRAT